MAGVLQSQVFLSPSPPRSSKPLCIPVLLLLAPEPPQHGPSPSVSCTSALGLFSVLQSLWAPSVGQRAGLSQWGEEPEQSSLAAAPSGSLGHWMSAALLADLQTMPLLFLLPALAPTSRGRAQGTRCSLFPKGFFVAEDLDVLFVPPGQAPADFESISSCFSYPPGLASVLDEGWTCADLHLSQAGLDQQDHNTR